MEKIEMSPIKSSNLIAGGYDPINKRCRVEFKNGVYESQKEVPQDVYDAFQKTFQTADSSGSHFHKYLKQYDFKKVS